jgi:RIP homotypic interaction motif
MAYAARPRTETGVVSATRTAGTAQTERFAGAVGSAAVSAGSVTDRGVTVHQVRLGPTVQAIRVSRSAGVQVGDHNRQLNRYRFKLDRPQVSLDDLLEGHPARLRALERLAANPRSWIANYAFRQHLSAGPTRPSSRVLFADAAGGPAVRISARVDEYGATVVENSRGVQVTDHGMQRNDFRYKLAGQEISLERTLRDRPDLVRGLAMTIRHAGNAAVQRSFARRLSNAYTRGSAPTLGTLDRDWPGRSLSAEYGAGVQVGTGNSRTDQISVDVRRLALTGWQATAERITATIDTPAAPRTSIEGPSTVPGISAL